MSSTRQVLRRGLSYLMGDFVLDPDGSIPTCSAQGGAAGITAIDALLSYYEDDYFKDWFFVLPQGPTGSGSYEVTRVPGSTQTTGTLTLEPDASAQIASAQPYELHRYSPAWKHQALNNARSLASDVLWRPRWDETLVIDDRLTNSDGETFSATFTGWTHTAGTWTQESSAPYIRHGTYSFKGVASGAAAQLTQTLNINVNELTTQAVTFRFWVYVTTADVARIRIDWDGGTTYSSSAYHTGRDEWQLLYVITNVPSTATQVVAVLEVADGYTAYFDAGWLAIGEIARYTIPTSLLRGGMQAVEMQSSLYVTGENEGDYYPITPFNPPKPGRRMRLRGRGLLSEVTTETGTMEVSEPEVQLLYAHALDWLSANMMMSGNMEDRERMERDRAMWQVSAQQLRQRSGFTRPSWAFVSKSVRLVEDGETNYLVLLR